MKVRFAEPFSRAYTKLSHQTKQNFEKQLKFLIRNLRHPSLHAKKYNEANDVWQARVDSKYRFYFQILGETYLILNIFKHPE
ncbi:MAG: hypothetical protein Greene071421_580 [Parcubacteria group bacterium Greene0714_21]|nr:MAG: hypothetical protein Greene041639_490 [Parcubacteria group bacterium Greene0416_39]TSD03846.1 MAG: hypothetical protein Greene071421_580 [Parcubacteria group bacterium Greene0714_21]